MKKGDIVDQVCDAVKTKSEAVKAVNLTFFAVSEALVSGETVRIDGFGTFKIVERAARKGRNPKTGKSIDIASKKVIKFTPCNTLKESVNN